MVFLNEEWYAVVVVVHIIFAIAAVGAVSVTDYLHLTGLKNKIREKKLLFIYPLLGKMIIYLIAGIILTGGILVANNPGLLSNSLFKLKMVLFLVIIVNGWILHSYVSPSLDRCVIKGGKVNCSRKVLLVSAFAGSVSLASWYGVFILSLTKSAEYSVSDFISFYLIAIFALFLIALFVEMRAKKWEDLI